MSEATIGTRYHIGAFTLEINAGCLKDQHGVPVHLRKQTFKVLVYIAQRRLQLVHRRDIIDSVWKGRIVTDDSLTQCVREIRRALGDKSRHLLQTVHCSGYRINCTPASADATAVTIPESGVNTIADTLRLSTPSQWHCSMSGSLTSIEYSVTINPN